MPTRRMPWQTDRAVSPMMCSRTDQPAVNPRCVMAIFTPWIGRRHARQVRGNAARWMDAPSNLIEGERGWGSFGYVKATKQRPTSPCLRYGALAPEFYGSRMSHGSDGAPLACTGLYAAARRPARLLIELLAKATARRDPKSQQPL
jgi:hypothetical protein